MHRTHAIRTHAVLLLLVLPFACGDADGTSTETGTTQGPSQVCEEPDFVAPGPVQWATCGCGAGLWRDYCGAHTLQEQHCAWAYTPDGLIEGGTCHATLCVPNSDFPVEPTPWPGAACDPYEGITTVCWKGGCWIPCAEETEACPEGMKCVPVHESGYKACIHVFP